MFYSVVIPTYNEAATIRECLKSLSNQTIEKNKFEIIVVDDGSTDNTDEIVKEFAVKYVRQQNQGPASARNTGVKVATGDIILFTDADCIPAPNWVEEMVKPFLADKNIAGVKGIYYSKQRELISRFVQLEYEDRYDLMKKDKYIDFIDTYSAAYLKTVFLQYGGFDTEFRTAMGEDTELSFRISEAGHRLVFNPNAFVYHYHPNSWKQYLKRKYKAALWRILILKKHPQKFVRDNHTPQLLKFQIIASLLFVLCVAFGFLSNIYSLTIVSLIFLGITYVSPTAKALKKDLIVGLITPAIIFLRSIFYSAGLFSGVVRFLI